MTVGKKIRELRLHKCLSQQQLATKINVGTNTLGLWERDVTAPYLYSLIALADFFDVTLDELCCREERVSIHGDKCPACAKCTRKTGGPNCSAWRSCHDYKILFAEAWGEICKAAKIIKDNRDSQPEENTKEMIYKS